MLEKRFGLQRRPFPTTPDSSLYYPANPHERSLSILLRALREEEGLVLLTGEPGTGKTLLGQILLERLGEEVQSAFLPHTHFPSRAALLQAILFDLGLPYEEGHEQILRLRLTEAVLKACSENKRTVVVVDEAHLLDIDLLEELRLLGNLEAGRKAFQVVCLALPTLLTTLRNPRLACWNQRLAVRAILEAMDLEEATDYLLHHVRSAGGRPEAIFDDYGLNILAQGCRGIPRLLNQACHRAFHLAAEAEQDRIDTEVALEALAELGLNGETEAEIDPQPSPEIFSSFEIGRVSNQEKRKSA